jgi:Nucleotidyl transferase AbiEii toxin, Type IV TA system
VTGFDPYLGVLSSVQRLLWPQLRPTVDLGLVLYGSTAIALRLGHRESVDFKFFSDCLLDVTKLHQALPCLKSASALQDAQDKLTVLVRPNGGYAAVKLSFFGGLGFGRVCSPEETMDGVLQVASLADLMATKLKVLMRRSQAKDYLDLAAMIEASVSLPQGLAAAREMFGPAFQPSEALKAMTYFEGGGLDSLPRHTVRTLIDAVATVDDLPTVSILSRSQSTPPDR